MLTFSPHQDCLLPFWEELDRLAVGLAGAWATQMWVGGGSCWALGPRGVQVWAETQHHARSLREGPRPGELSC